MTRNFKIFYFIFNKLKEVRFICGKICLVSFLIINETNKIGDTKTGEPLHSTKDMNSGSSSSFSSETDVTLLALRRRQIILQLQNLCVPIGRGFRNKAEGQRKELVEPRQ